MAGTRKLLKYQDVSQGVYNVYYTNGVYLGKLYKEIDGYYVWWDDANRCGCYESHVLRELADKLDELNYQYDKELQQFFAREEFKETGIKPWPGFCQNCEEELWPPDRTDCPSCGACD